MQKVKKFKKAMCLMLAMALQTGVLNIAFGKITAESFKRHIGEIIISIVGAGAAVTTGIIIWKFRPSNDKKTDRSLLNNDKDNSEQENAAEIKRLEEENAKLRNENIRKDIIEILEENKRVRIEYAETRKRRHEDLASRIVKKFNNNISEADLRSFLAERKLKDKCINAIVRYYHAISSS